MSADDAGSSWQCAASKDMAKLLRSWSMSFLSLVNACCVEVRLAVSLHTISIHPFTRRASIHLYTRQPIAKWDTAVILARNFRISRDACARHLVCVSWTRSNFFAPLGIRATCPPLPPFLFSCQVPVCLRPQCGAQLPYSRYIVPHPFLPRHCAPGLPRHTLTLSIP